MKVIIVPTSGGGFIGQLGVMRHLCNLGVIPEIAVACSGGCLASYILLAAGFIVPELDRIVSSLSSDVLLRKHVPWLPQLPSFLKYKSIYRISPNSKPFLIDILSQDKLHEMEIWAGLHNKTTHNAEFFCNKSKEEAIMKELIPSDAARSGGLRFCNFDISTLADIIYGSASIPFFLDGTRIGTSVYVDGGVSAASPITFCGDTLKSIAKEKGEPLQLFYISSYDLDQYTESPTFGGIISDLLHSNAVLNCEYAKRLDDWHEVVVADLQNFLEVYHDTSYCIVLSPIEYVSLDFTHFSPSEALEKMRSVNIRFRVWLKDKLT